MTLKTLLIILLALVIGIIFLKALRMLLSIALTIVLTHFIYYTLFTYPGAVKFGVFRQTLDLSSYKIDTSEYDKAKLYKIDPGLKIGKDTISAINCEKNGPLIICEVEEKE